MVSALDSGLSGLGSGPGTLCCVLGQDTFITLTVPLSTQAYKCMSTGEFNAAWG